MSDSERAWYQNGWVVLCIVAVIVGFGIPLYDEWQKSQRIYVIPHLRGRVHQPMFGDPDFVVTVWHQHTGNLRNGYVEVTIQGDMAGSSDGTESAVHSFEVWEPNRENSVTLTLPLSHFDATQEIPFKLELRGRDMRPFAYTDAWLGNTWKSNLEADGR